MRLCSVLLLLFSLLFTQEIQPEDVQSVEGPSVQEYYGYIQEAIEEGDWWAAIDFGELVLYHFPESPFRQEIPYYIGLAYYRLNQHELANNILSDYLKQATSPKHFEEALEMKFEIAEFYHQGGKKRLFGSHKLPAMVSGEEDALQIYDEIITTLPHHEYAVRALLHRAEIQASFRDFKESVDSLQLLIRRFPKHDLAPEAYLQINKVYLKQCIEQHLDPDLLDLAAVNVRKFRLAFPRETRIGEAERAFGQMQELFANNLLETGLFFQKRKKQNASRIYYHKVLKNYPGTNAAQKAQRELTKLDPSPSVQ
jgi:outer membrane protein assembly factor BamD (BamD/ComL family)